MNTLPLSWCRKDAEYSTYHTVKLPLSAMTWISTAEIPFAYSAEDLYSDISRNYEDFIVRGLGYGTAKYFQEKGADVLNTGIEAVIALDKSVPVKQSVLELAKRGYRHGYFIEVTYTKENEKKLRQLISESSHGKEPNLNYLYRQGFDKSLRCFVLKTPKNQWLGALTISLLDESYAHTESILRRSGAPVGVMEALFVSVMDTLKNEGYEYFSLGEVPFILGENNKQLRERYLIHRIYKNIPLLSRTFNYNGLYNFKNKFGPIWFPKYLAAKPGISVPLMIDLYFKSSFHDLTVFKLLKSLRKRLPIRLKTA